MCGGGGLGGLVDPLGVFKRLPTQGFAGAAFNPVGHSFYAPVEERAAVAGGVAGFFLGGGPGGALKGAATAYSAVKGQQMAEAQAKAIDEARKAQEKQNTEVKQVITQQYRAQQKATKDAAKAVRDTRAARSAGAPTRGGGTAITGSQRGTLLTGPTGVSDTQLNLGKTRLGA